MTDDWLRITCVIAFLVAGGLGFLLFVNWKREQAFRRYTDRMNEAERVVRHGDQCPWNLK